MKKSLYFINVLLFLSNFHCQSQSYGFVQSECGIVYNPSYHIENYQFGTHGNGFRLYHDGINIYEEQPAAPNGVYCLDLKFIDYTTGFFVVRNANNNYYTVHKIINDSVLGIGSCSGFVYNYFIASRHTVYLSMWNIIMMPIVLRLSDLLPQKYLSNYNSPISDTTVFDTIMGIPFCQTLDEINYRYIDSNDTSTFTIRFSVDTLANIGQQKISDIFLYPNPAEEFIKIKATQNGTHFSVHILNNLGVRCKSIIMDPSNETEIFIGDLTQGVYFIVIENGFINEVYKLIKI